MADKTKFVRIIYLYVKLNEYNRVNREKYCENFGISDRTFRRDLSEVQNLLKNINGLTSPIKTGLIDNETYFYIEGLDRKTIPQENILPILKILVSSKAFSKKEMTDLKDMLVSRTFKRDTLLSSIDSDVKNYKSINCSQKDDEILELSDKVISEMPIGTGYSTIIWELEIIIYNKNMLRMNYTTANSNKIDITVIPLDVVFAEFYFYLILAKEDTPDDYFFYRIDRINTFSEVKKIIGDYIYENYKNSNIKNIVQFMQKGKKTKIKLAFWGASLPALLDRIPTADIIEKKDNKTILEAECYTNGMKMWLLAQGKYAEVLEPEWFREEMKETIMNMYENYN